MICMNDDGLAVDGEDDGGWVGSIVGGDEEGALDGISVGENVGIGGRSCFNGTMNDFVTISKNTSSSPSIKMTVSVFSSSNAGMNT